ncbi:hypothetical protein L6164_031185 [Bauhinia variegata]|uniref:Uncharacterized protein n=1 Tax=Bauhinia variegata TaxID=167791 RepID=A0ACB9LEI0_BAUVA|nr:hypothetical protein L6164_031185 [Bauhinia variegata]
MWMFENFQGLFSVHKYLSAIGQPTSIFAKFSPEFLSNTKELARTSSKVLGPYGASNRGRLYEYANNSVRTTIERYKKACAASSNTESVAEANTQFYQQEASKLRRQIKEIQNLNRHILGEALSTLSLKELKNLEGRLEKGLSRVRSRKHETLFAEVEFMQKREMELQNHNNYLRAKIAEHERAREQQPNLMPATVCNSIPSQQSYDRNFFPVNLLDSNHQYSRSDQTALQLV